MKNGDIIKYRGLTTLLVYEGEENGKIRVTGLMNPDFTRVLNKEYIKPALDDDILKTLQEYAQMHDLSVNDSGASASIDELGMSVSDGVGLVILNREQVLKLKKLLNSEIV